MGLDQYAFKTREGEREEIAYWRKHPNLHGWMERLYRARGGDGDFNCVAMELTPADLDALERDIREDALPHTDGFFFGTSYGDDDERERDFAFVQAARAALADGYRVFYDSWW